MAKEKDDLITVCDKCKRASCWQGEFYCDQYREAGTIRVPRHVIEKANFEHSSWLKTNEQLAYNL